MPDPSTGQSVTAALEFGGGWPRPYPVGCGERLVIEWTSDGVDGGATGTTFDTGSGWTLEVLGEGCAQDADSLATAELCNADKFAVGAAALAANAAAAVAGGHVWGLELDDGNGPFARAEADGAATGVCLNCCRADACDREIDASESDLRDGCCCRAEGQCTSGTCSAWLGDGKRCGSLATSGFGSLSRKSRINQNDPSLIFGTILY